MGNENISVTILTRDSARHLRQVLAALTPFNDVVVLDSGSTDRTLEIAAAFPNVRIAETAFKGFGPLHNEASALARHDWIFSIDSDELLTPELAEEIRRITLDPNCVYCVSRRNMFNNKWIRWCGWHPDIQTRLFNRTRTRFTDAQVHEGVISDGMAQVRLRNPIIHYSYDSVSDFLTKMQRYSDLFARQNQGRLHSSFTKAIAHGFGAFLKSYLLKRGFLGGAEGFVISIYNAEVAYYKYMKLAEANRTAPHPRA